MKRRISEQVVVITGASTGIGRQCAIEMVRRGATVVAAARGREALRSLAALLADGPGRIEVVQVDVASWEEVEMLARTTVEHFGRIDTWINNAAVAMYATVADSTVEEVRRVLEVNLLGQIHGMKAALSHMRSQGAGTIINVGSVLSRRAVPLMSAYVASKHALAGFTEALRMELEYEKSGIDVTLLLPGSINTPLFAHARSKLGVQPSPARPVYQPDAVTEAILFAAQKPRRDIVVGGAGKALLLLQRLSPRLVDWYMVQGGRYFRAQASDRPDDGLDNLFKPFPGPGAVYGRFGEGALRSSLYTRVFEQSPWAKVVAAVPILLLASDGLFAAAAGSGLIALAEYVYGRLDREKGREGSGE